MPSQTEIREQVTNQIVEALQRGVTPWRKPWSALENAGFPTNVASKKLYRGINPLLLQLAAQKREFQSQWWGTYRQWQSLGGQVKKRPTDVAPGKWGTKIVFWKPVTKITKNAKGVDEESTFPILREYVVFSADQVEGDAVERFRAHPPTVTTVIDYEPAEKVIAATGADIRHVAGDQAFYRRPPDDFIVLPFKSQFIEGLGYYDASLHELCHWSECRLGWTGSYALGELRAELGASYLMAAVGLPLVDASLLRNTTAYLSHWIDAMRADHRVIFQVSSAASKAADFILSFSRVEQPEAKPEEVATA